MVRILLFIISLNSLFIYQSFAGMEDTFSSFRECESHIKNSKVSDKTRFVKKCRDAFPETEKSLHDTTSDASSETKLKFGEASSKVWKTNKYEIHSKKAVIWSKASEVLFQWQTSRNYDQKNYTIRNLGCSVEVSRQAEIYDNCIIDKLPVGAKSVLRNSIVKSCQRIACTPGFMDKFKY